MYETHPGDFETHPGDLCMRFLDLEALNSKNIEDICMTKTACSTPDCQVIRFTPA